MTNILKKPYSTIQRIEFVSKYSHQEGKKIFETNDALYAIEKNQTVIDGKVVEDVNYEKNLKELQKKLINTITLTSVQLERAIYNSCGMDFDDVIDFIKKENNETDSKSLKIELKNNKIKRLNPLINKMLAVLGYCDDDIDNLFLKGELPKKEGNNE